MKPNTSSNGPPPTLNQKPPQNLCECKPFSLSGKKHGMKQARIRNKDFYYQCRQKTGLTRQWIFRGWFEDVEGRVAYHLKAGAISSPYGTHFMAHELPLPAGEGEVDEAAD